MENSKHVKKRTPESPKDDNTKELSEEWNEQKRTTSEEQLRAGEQLDEPASEILEAEKKIEQLTIQPYDPNSEHIKEEAPGSPKDKSIKEPSKEWNKRQRTTSKEQLNADKQVDEPGSVQETKEEVIEQLTRELHQAYTTEKNLKIDITRLKRAKYDAELAKENLKIEKDKKIKKLQNKIDQLEGALQREVRKSTDILRKLQRNGQLCSNDCALCCLLWICNKKLHKYPCGPHLRTLITIEAERKLGRTENINLSCKAFLRILVKYDVLNIYPKCPEIDRKRERYPNKSNAWEKLMGVDEKKRAVIIGSQFWDEDKLGHCWVCDLETNSRTENACLTIYDPQHFDSCKEVEEDVFRTYVKKVDGVLVFTVNFKKLEEIIKDHEEWLMHATSNDCETYYTDSNCMSRSQIPTESSDEPKIIEFPDEPTGTESTDKPKPKLPKELTTTDWIEESTATEWFEKPRKPRTTGSIDKQKPTLPKKSTATKWFKKPTANEQFEGPTGNEWLEELSNNERFEGPTANEWLDELSTNEEFEGSTGNEWLKGLSTNERFEGPTDNEWLVELSANERFEGTAGNEWLEELSNNERFEGPTGNEWLVELSNNERFEGPTANEWLVELSANERFEEPTGYEWFEN